MMDALHTSSNVWPKRMPAKPIIAFSSCPPYLKLSPVIRATYYAISVPMKVTGVILGKEDFFMSSTDDRCSGKK